jgi:RHS repeat-associated protein
MALIPQYNSSKNYHPFGMLMPGRSYSSTAYKYGFNGQEKDDETKGAGNSLDFGARVYDPRLGRWLAVDMAAKSAPSWTPYRFGFDNPLRYRDPDGNWEEDGHFWTVYAMGVAMGMKVQTARELAVHAEYYDHYVHKDGSMSIHPNSKGPSWGKDGGLGTWADPKLQKDWHGLTGGAQNEVLFDATYRVLMGELDQLHKIGDAWAHSYIDECGDRVMYGQHGRDEPWYAGILRKYLGDITFEHAKAGPEHGRIADNISQRKDAYMGYVATLKALFNQKQFIYNSEVTNTNPDLGIFNYVQKYGSNRDNNIFLFKSYISLMNGQNHFSNLSQEQSNLFGGYLKQQNIQYESHPTDCGKQSIDICH